MAQVAGKGPELNALVASKKKKKKKKRILGFLLFFAELGM
jgi:hypothetical protein